MQSAAVIAFLTKVFEQVDEEAVAEATSIQQFNIRVDDAVAQTYTLRVRDRTITDEAADDSTVEVTIDDGDFVALFKGEATLVDLQAAGTIEVSGDESELAKIDEGRQALLLKLKELMEQAAE